MKRAGAIAIALLALLLVATSLWAATPQLITHQGRLTDSANKPVTDGAYLIKFQIYADSLGGSALWNSNFQTVPVANGLFTYLLGKDVAFPADLFTASADRWLGITVGTDAEIAPRARLTASAYALQSASADHATQADVATTAVTAQHMNWSGLTAVPAGFADGVDNDAGGDITGVTAGTGLTGGGTSGAVTVGVANNGVTSTQIADNTITDGDISGSANIDRTKILGTAATLSNSQTFTGTNTHSGLLIVGDSTLRANEYGVRMGHTTNPGASNYTVLRLERGFSGTPGNAYGLYTTIYNATNFAYGGYLRAEAVAGSAFGVYGEGVGDGTVVRYGVHGYGTVSSGSTSGVSYGIRGLGRGGAAAYGVYGSASEATTNWAGYFSGSVNVTGTLSKGGGAFRIDHPLDPENKYLQHSFVESPDMKNIYDGVITTDSKGFATVEMPSWFDALNRVFRYQLTVIGQFAQAIIAQKLEGGKFLIQTDKPNVEVSWQVTGIRHDKWADANRIEVEVDKLPDQRGKYAHPAEWGQPEEKGIDWESTKAVREARDQKR